jgi:hypothetical protein
MRCNAAICSAMTAFILEVLDVMAGRDRTQGPLPIESQFLAYDVTNCGESRIEGRRAIRMRRS